MEVLCADSLERLGADTWEALAAGDSLFLSGPWLASVEPMIGRAVRYLVVSSSDQEAPIDGLVCYLIPEPLSYRFNDPPQLLVEDAAAEDMYPALVCVSPFGYEVGIRGHSRSAPESASTELLLDAFEATAVELGASSSGLLYLRAGPDAALERALRSRGYLAATLSADAYLTIEWPSFEEYVATRSKPRRQRIRREVRGFAESGIEISVHGADALGMDCALLQSDLHASFGHEEDPAEIMRGFDRIRTHLHPFTRVLLAHRDERLIGYDLWYEYRERLYVKMGAYSREHVSNTDFYYFNVTFYEAIRHAVARGLRAIHYGPESYEAKVMRGCRLQPLACYLKPAAASAAVEETVRRHDGRGRALLSRFET